jgi:hypothetical protein
MNVITLNERQTAELESYNHVCVWVPTPHAPVVDQVVIAGGLECRVLGVEPESLGQSLVSLGMGYGTHVSASHTNHLGGHSGSDQLGKQGAAKNA